MRAIRRGSENNDLAEIDFLLQLGALYRLQGRLSEARDCFQKGLTLSGQSDSGKLYWAFVNQLGLVARLSARQEEALTYCRQVLAEPSPPVAERAEALNVMGLVAYDRREWDKALEHFEQALDLYRSLEDDYQIARILNNRGLVFLRSTRWDEAAKSYREAIQYFQDLDNPAECYKAVMNLGNVFLMRKAYPMAIEHYQEALGVFRQCNFSIDLAHLYNNLGMAYAGLADWKVAEDYFKASIEAWQRLEDAYNLANVLDNFGYMLIRAGQIDAAQKVLNEALAVLSSAPDNPGNNRLRKVIEERLAQL
jgi:tetratricopeptide (TPR) repeat protein